MTHEALKGLHSFSRLYEQRRDGIEREKIKMEQETKRGGHGRGQGRKPIAKDGELMKARQVRMTDEEWAKCRRLGGAAWIRAKVKEAKDV